MLVHKCDNCKKEIKGRDKEIIAGYTWPQFSFCGRCGKPIIAFLKKRKLLQPAKTTVA
jgi:DNA-directed RNA polymerase subunit RPC12/RpoP